MPTKKQKDVAWTVIEEWTLPPAATLGSLVRAKGILLEIRARLPAAVKKLLDVKGGVLALRKPEGSEDDLSHVSAIVRSTLDGIERLPVIPRELEDILTISTSERHRWLKDGRLRSAGTRTVRLRGRAKQITFHVFDPRHVEDVLDGDLVEAWREDDAVRAAENRRLAAGKAALTRLQKKAPKAEGAALTIREGQSPGLEGWEEFAREMFLR